MNFFLRGRCASLGQVECLNTLPVLAVDSRSIGLFDWDLCNSLLYSIKSQPSKSFSLSFRTPS